MDSQIPTIVANYVVNYYDRQEERWCVESCRTLAIAESVAADVLEEEPSWEVFILKVEGVFRTHVSIRREALVVPEEPPQIPVNDEEVPRASLGASQAA